MASGLTVNFECVVTCMLKFWSHDFPSLSGREEEDTCMLIPRQKETRDVKRH